MPAFFLTLLACALATLAGRDAVRVAQLAGTLGSGAGLWLVIIVSSIATSALAAWLGSLLAPSMEPAAKNVFLALALGLTALELLVRRAPRKPAEPTRSLGAILLVQLASQMTDGVRFLVLAFSTALAAPGLAAAGGALASILVLSAAMMVQEDWEARLPSRAIRWGAAAIFFLAACAVAISALGLAK